MGQTLSAPVTDKQSSVCQDERFKVGASCMQGWRVTMEDSHTHILSLPDDPETAFFAVYDGHGGAAIAQYAGQHLHNYVVRRPEYQLGDIEESLKKGFLELDAAMKREDSLLEEVAGSTAVVVLIKGNTLYCANVGDSRAIASVDGRVEALSVDHKPNNEGEMRRIVAGGGHVEFNRVNGNLALSRALGDFGFKRNRWKSAEEQIVTAYPDVVVREITEDWEFIVIACDGIWDVLSSQNVVDFCRADLSRSMEPSEVCERLMQKCLAPDCDYGGLGCDNMTVLIICLTPGITSAQLQMKLQSKVETANEAGEAPGRGFMGMGCWWSPEDADKAKEDGSQISKDGVAPKVAGGATPLISVWRSTKEGAEKTEEPEDDDSSELR